MTTAPMTVTRASLTATGAPRQLDFIDTVLVVIFLLGFYLERRA